MKNVNFENSTYSILTTCMNSVLGMAQLSTILRLFPSPVLKQGCSIQLLYFSSRGALQVHVLGMGRRKGAEAIPLLFSSSPTGELPAGKELESSNSAEGRAKYQHRSKTSRTTGYNTFHPRIQSLRDRHSYSKITLASKSWIIEEHLHSPDLMISYPQK